MMKMIKKFLVIISVALCALVVVTASNSYAFDSNLPVGDVGDRGEWNTRDNRDAVIQHAQEDLNNFLSNYDANYIETGVPLVAKLGIVIIRALSYVSKVLDSSLVRFVNIFLIVAFLFWVMLQAYKLISDDKTKAMPTVEEIVKKGALLGIWLLLLDGGIQWLFGAIMGPIFGFSSYVSNLILNATANVGGFALTDNYPAIHAYAAAHLTDTSIFTPDFAANIICVPARLSGFYYGAIKYGFTLLAQGLGTSTLTFLVGLILVGIFIYTSYKFLFVAIGVVVDLFLVVITLPFTAIASTVNKTSYKGIAADIYNGFLGLFKSSDLSSQIKKFVDAAVYFVSLSIVIAIAGALLGYAIDVNSRTYVITILNGDVVTLLLTGALVAYIAYHTEDFAKSIGGAIDYATGTELQNDVKKMYNDTKKKVYEILNTWKKSK